MKTLASLKKMTDRLPEQETLMPVLFVGHGSPMNAIEDNEFSQWRRAVAATIPKPTAILCVSAHRETKGTFVTAMARPETIHDFGGFPKALYEMQYPAHWSPWLVQEVQKTILTTTVGADHDWWLDHGCWSILEHLYPHADIPVVEMSLDYTKWPEYHYHLAAELRSLRKKWVLIIGSGNMVHNFQYARFSGDFNTHYGLDRALEANDTFKKLILDGDHQSLIDYHRYSKATALSAPTPEHYLPLLYALALRGKDEPVRFFNDAVIWGSFSMTSVVVGW